jgi:DNA topoisomerase-1
VLQKIKYAALLAETSCICKLKKSGIGCQATYATILDTTMTRGCAKTEKRFLIPTPLGIVMDSLRGNSLINLDSESETY